MTHRPLKVTRGRADRDPMFAAMWYDGADLVVSPLTGKCICQDQHRRGYCTEPGCPYALNVPGPMWDLAPLPPEPSGLEARWKAALEKADAVVAEMWKHEAVYDPVEMLAAVSDVIHADFTPADVLAAYRKRMEAKRG